MDVADGDVKNFAMESESHNVRTELVGISYDPGRVSEDWSNDFFPYGYTSRSDSLETKKKIESINIDDLSSENDFSDHVFEKDNATLEGDIFQFDKPSHEEQNGTDNESDWDKEFGFNEPAALEESRGGTSDKSSNGDDSSSFEDIFDDIDAEKIDEIQLIDDPRTIQKNMANMLKLLLKDPPADVCSRSGEISNLTSSGIPESCCLVDKLQTFDPNSSYRILKYPPGCTLITLKASQSQGNLRGQGFIDWLDNIITQKISKKKFFSYSELKDSCELLIREFEKSERCITCDLSQVIQKCCKAALENKEKETAIDFSQRFMKLLGRNLRRKHTQSNLMPDRSQYSLLHHTLSILELISKSDLWDYGDILGVSIYKEKVVPHGHSRSAVNIMPPQILNSLNSKSSINLCTFSEMLWKACMVFPDHVDSFALIELAAVSHNYNAIMEHCARSDSEEQYGSIQGDSVLIDPPVFSGDLSVDGLPSFHSMPGYYQWVAQHPRNVMFTKFSALAFSIYQNYIAVFDRANLKASGEQSSKRHCTSQSAFDARCKDMEGFRTEMSRVYSAGIPPAPTFNYPEGKPLFIQANALTDLSFILLSLSPLNYEERGDSLSSALSYCYANWDLCEDSIGGRNIEQQSNYSSDQEHQNFEEGRLGDEVERSYRQDDVENGNSSSSSYNSNDSESDNISRKKRVQQISQVDSMPVINAEMIHQRNSISFQSLGVQSQGVRCRPIKEVDDAQSFYDILFPIYKQLPEGCLQKSRTAHALGLICNIMRKLDRAEGFHLEAVLVLDNLPLDDLGESALISPFGMRSLESLGYALLNGNKYAYAVKVLERAIDCFREYFHEEYDKLIRKLTLLTFEQRDIQRALEYHNKALIRAKKTESLNEFVFLIKNMSQLLVEQGWYPNAEQYLRVAYCLLSGSSLDSVCIRNGNDTAMCNHLSCHNDAITLLPKSFSLTDDGLSSDMILLLHCTDVERYFGKSNSLHGYFKGVTQRYTGHSSHPTEVDNALSQQSLADTNVLGNWADTAYSMTKSTWQSVTKFIMDVQQLEILMKLVDVFMVWQRYDTAIQILLKLYRISSRQGSKAVSIISNQLAICYYKLRLISAAEKWLGYVEMEAEKSLYSISNSMAETNADQWKNQRGSIKNNDQTQIGNTTRLRLSIMPVLDVGFLLHKSKCMLASDEPANALYCSNIALCVVLDQNQLKHPQLGKIYYFRGKCLHQLVRKSWDNVSASDVGNVETPGFPIDISICSSPPAFLSDTCIDPHDSIHSRMTSLNNFNISKLRQHSDNRRDSNESNAVTDSWNRGSMCSQIGTKMIFSPNASGFSINAQDPQLRKTPWTSETDLASVCESAFLTAQSHFRLAGDPYRQGKCFARITEMHLTRIFKRLARQRVSSPNDTTATERNEDAVAILQCAEVHASSSLELSGDIASPMLLLLCLTNAAELHWLMGRPKQAFQSWKEAQMLLNLTYLQQQDSKEFFSSSRTHHKVSSSLSGENFLGTRFESFMNTGTESKGRSAPASPYSEVNSMKPRVNATPIRKGGKAWDPLSNKTAIRAISSPSLFNSMKSNPEKYNARKVRPKETPLGHPSLPTVFHSPSTLLKVYELLSRIVRLNFMMASATLATTVSLDNSIQSVFKSILSLNTHLLAGWMYLDEETKQYKAKKRSERKRKMQHRRAQPSNTNTSTGGSSGSALNFKSLFDSTHRLPGNAAAHEKNISRSPIEINPPQSMKNAGMSVNDESMHKRNRLDGKSTFVRTPRHEMKTFPGCISAQPEQALTSGNHRSVISDMTAGKRENFVRMASNPQIINFESTMEVDYMQQQRSKKFRGIKNFINKSIKRPYLDRRGVMMPGAEALLCSPSVISGTSNSPLPSYASSPESRRTTVNAQKTPVMRYRTKGTNSPGIASASADSSGSTWRRISSRKISDLGMYSARRRDREDSTAQGQLTAAFNDSGYDRSIKSRRSRTGSRSFGENLHPSRSFTLIEQAINVTGTGLRSQMAANVARSLAATRESLESQPFFSEQYDGSDSVDYLGLSDEDFPFLPALGTHSTFKSDESELKCMEENIDMQTYGMSMNQLHGGGVHEVSGGHSFMFKDSRSGDQNAEMSLAGNSTMSRSSRKLKTKKLLKGTKVSALQEELKQKLNGEIKLMKGSTIANDADCNEVPVVSDVLRPSRRKSTNLKSSSPSPLSESCRSSKYCYMNTLTTTSEYRALYASFCFLKQVLKQYSTGKINMKEIRRKNIQIMSKIVAWGKKLERPINQGEREKRAPTNLQQRNTNSTTKGLTESSPPLLPRLSSREVSMIDNDDFESKEKYQRSSTMSILDFENIRGSTDSVLVPLKIAPSSSAMETGGISGTSSGNTPSRNCRKFNSGGKRFSSFTPTSRIRSDSCSLSTNPNNALNQSSMRDTSFYSIFNATLVPVCSRPLRSRNSVFPSTFSFVMHIEDMYFYYAPATGQMRIILNGGTTVPVVKRTHQRLVPLDGNEEDASSDEAEAQQNKEKREGAPPFEPAPADDKAIKSFDLALLSISKRNFMEPLPLIPRFDAEGEATNDSVNVLVEVLSPQIALFVVTALLLEQPVLLLCAPGSEEDTVFIETALLRLICPFEWHYPLISLCPPSSSQLLHQLIKSKEPFFAATYASVLDSALFNRSKRVVYPTEGNSPLGDICSGDADMDTSKRSNMRDGSNHVSIVDLSLGTVLPSSSMEYVAHCTLSRSYAPDADGSEIPSYHSTEFGGELPKSERWSMSESDPKIMTIRYLLIDGKVESLCPTQLPPLPARYRHRLGMKIDVLIQEDAEKTFSKTSQSNLVRSNSNASLVGLVGKVTSGFGGTTNKYSKSGKVLNSRRPATFSSSKSMGQTLTSRMAECLRIEVFTILVSLLKPYRLFLSKSSDSSDSSGDIELLADKFITFVKSDLRLFTAYFLQTKMFKSFLNYHKKAPPTVPPLHSSSYRSSSIPHIVRKQTGGAAPSSPESHASQMNPAGPIHSVQGQSLNYPSTVWKGTRPSSPYTGGNATTFAPLGPRTFISNDIMNYDNTSSPNDAAKATPVTSAMLNRKSIEFVRSRVDAASDSGLMLQFPHSAPTHSIRTSRIQSSVPDNQDSWKKKLLRGASNATDVESVGKYINNSKNCILHRERFEADIQLRMSAKVELIESLFHGKDSRMCLHIVCFLIYHDKDGTSQLGSNEFKLPSTANSSTLNSPEGSVISNSKGAASPAHSTLRGSRPMTRISPRNAFGSTAFFESSRPLKVKKRWCIIDATRVSYYRSRSSKYVKGFIPFEPAKVSLVTSPYLITPNQLRTSNKDFVALVCKKNSPLEPPLPRMLVLRAEDVNMHHMMVRVLKAKLTPREHLSEMKRVYKIDFTSEG